MADQAESRGMKTNAARLSQLMQGVSVISMVVSKGQGIDTLKESIASFVARHHEILAGEFWPRLPPFGRLGADRQV